MNNKKLRNKKSNEHKKSRTRLKQMAQIEYSILYFHFNKNSNKEMEWLMLDQSAVYHVYKYNKAFFSNSKNFKRQEIEYQL